ncbi:hydroxyacylglutathione hydrolase [Pseudomonas lopnurensis]|uniref:hydroxyacylglutathione hydrolase n=1 Tax=Pseudomonas lopnurensis TaxID=1477517 RepID=UPI001879EB19|nr:hydroxyacylglutathione hydrolase [Pseudomonas lopnurensis]MBE7374692.1 hydroxyacylglutathione hydrolase [Pseudomonas lopnurensis]
MLKIEALPAFTDNYIWLLQDDVTRQCAAVDPGDAAPVLAWLQAHPGWQLSDILVTHHHHDHVGGVQRLKADTGARVYGPAAENIPARDEALGDNQHIQVLGHDLQVIAVPGHTLGHIAYFHADAEHPWLLCGDTLFAAGCGRLFEGSAAQMFDSLQRLASTPDNTLIYCTHEYTQSNLRFAQAVEPGNRQIAERVRTVAEWRAADRISLPTTLEIERATNPFLRSGIAAVREAARQHSGSRLDSDVEVFAALRAWKDRF